MKKRLGILLSLLLFGSGLATGWWLGVRVIPKVEEKKATPWPEAAPDQRSILVVGVDRLGGRQARLQGVWYIAYQPSRPSIYLLPIYPAAMEPIPDWDQRLEQAFGLNGQRAIKQEFLALLRSQDVHNWDAVILLDDIAMMEFVDLVGGVEGGVGGPRAVGNVPPAWEDRRSALQGQISLLNQLCARLDAGVRPKQFERVLNLIPDHLITDLKIPRVIEDWFQLSASTSPVGCVIPTPSVP